MGRRLRIGVDVDDVLADFGHAFHEAAEHVLGRQFPPMPLRWDFSDWGVTEEEREKIWQEIRKTPDFYYLKLRALPTVEEFLPYLSKRHELYFVSNRKNDVAGFPVREQTEFWLEDRGANIPCVILVHDKGPIVKCLELDVFIDDKPENLLRIQECSPNTRLFLMNGMHNKEFKEPAGWTRVSDLRTFVHHMEELGESTIEPAGA